jgi:hypothetical protein
MRNLFISHYFVNIKARSGVAVIFVGYIHAIRWMCYYFLFFFFFCLIFKEADIYFFFFKKKNLCVCVKVNLISQ